MLFWTQEGERPMADELQSSRGARNTLLWLGAGPELQTPYSHWVYLLGILLVQVVLLDMSLY